MMEFKNSLNEVRLPRKVLMCTHTNNEETNIKMYIANTHQFCSWSNAS